MISTRPITTETHHGANLAGASVPVIVDTGLDVTVFIRDRPNADKPMLVRFLNVVHIPIIPPN